LNTLTTMLTSTFARLSANGLQFGEAAYSLEEYLADLHGYIWNGLSSGKPMSQSQRNLQKTYVHNLCSLVLTINPDSRETDTWSTVRADLLRVQKEIDAALVKYPGEPDRAHLESMSFLLKKTFHFNPFNFIK
jgi:hypothetical protein